MNPFFVPGLFNRRCHHHRRLQPTEVCFDHEALVNDETRVAPYAAALRRVAAGRRVLDIGGAQKEGLGNLGPIGCWSFALPGHSDHNFALPGLSDHNLRFGQQPSTRELFGGY